LAIAAVDRLPGGLVRHDKWLTDFAYRISISWWIFPGGRLRSSTHRFAHRRYTGFESRVVEPGEKPENGVIIIINFKF
jgi:hypothetical protein